jgi:hypothetical protein
LLDLIDRDDAARICKLAAFYTVGNLYQDYEAKSRWINEVGLLAP